MEELEKDIEEWLETKVDKVHPEDGTTSKNKNGSPYLTFMVGGDSENEMHYLGKRFKEELEKNYLDNIKIEGPTVLYWRSKPKVKLDKDGYSLRARFVVDSL